MPSLRRSFQQSQGSSYVEPRKDRKRRVMFADDPNIERRAMKQRKPRDEAMTTSSRFVGDQFDDQEEEGFHFPRLDPGCEPGAGSEQSPTSSSSTRAEVPVAGVTKRNNVSAGGPQRMETEQVMANDYTRTVDAQQADEANKNEQEEKKFRQMTAFFHSEPFTKDEYRDVAALVKDRFDAPLKLVEEKGFAAFQEWRNKTLKRGVDVAEQKRRAEETLVADAKIVGAPRAYQRALFEIAKQRNTIIALGTGLGKTLISLLCIKHWADAFQDGKQTLFMVPSVALAIQQSSTLKANLPYSVQVACYATCTASNYRQQLSECNIIVATHGAIHDLLMHYGDLFSMDRFNFVVIDECHYATGNHAYATLMKRFYHPLPVEKRPRVLGLTASPLVKVKPTHSDEHLAEMLSALEQTLDAKVVSIHGLKDGGEEEMSNDSNGRVVQEGTPSGDSIVLRKSADEKVVLYKQYQPLAPLPPVERFPMHASRVREFQQIYGLYEELGPLALSVYCQTLAREISRNSFEKESTKEFRALVNHLNEIARFCSELCNMCPRGGRTDKLLALEELLEEQIENGGTSDTVGLVFVERRVTAFCLLDYFRFRQKHLKKNNWVLAKEARKRKIAPIMRASSPAFVAQCQPASLEPSPPSSQRSISPAPSDMTLSNGSTGSRGQFADAESSAGSIPETQLLPVVDLSHVTESVTYDLKSRSPPPSDQFKDAEEDELKDLDPYRGIRCVNARDTDLSAKKKQEIAERNLETPSVFSDQFVDPESDFEGVVETASSGGKETIRCKALVRNSTHIFKSLNLSRRLSNADEEDLRDSWLHQEARIRDILNGLRRGEINLLIATSVVEEGVDLQACSFVAAFDSLKSTKGYIQMKGRARQDAAQFFVFQDAGSTSKKALVLRSAQETEHRVDQFIAAHNYSSPLPQIHELADFSGGVSASCEITALELGGYKAEHGFVDLQSAKSLINRYALSLPFDSLSRSDKMAFQARLPVYMADQNQLLLPSHLPRELRVVTLPPQYRHEPIKMKNKLLALMGCVRLHRHGLLSQRLLPLTHRDLKDKMAGAARSAISLEIPRNTFTSFPTSGANTRKLFVYPIIQKNTRMEYLQNKILKHNGQVFALISTHNLEVIPEMNQLHPVFGIVTCSLGQEFSFHCTERQFDIILQFFAVVMNARWRRRSKSLFHRPRPLHELSTLIPPYYVGCLAATSGQLDWDYMRQLVDESKRSREERIIAVRNASKVEALPEPRLWVPIYDEAFTYISYGPSRRTCADKFPTQSEEDGIMIYQDYFRITRGYSVDKDCPLFDAQRLWALPFNKTSGMGVLDDATFVPKPVSGDHSDLYEVCKELRSLHLPQDACLEAPMACPNLLLMSTFLPQFLNHMEPFLTARSFISHCRNHLPRLAECLSKLPIRKVAEALTAKSCATESSYDKLEYFGDAVLKLVQTDCLIFSSLSQNLHEGDLSSLRSEMGCNARLERACKNLNINEFILTSPLGRGHWTPASLELFVPGSALNVENTETDATGKICADVVEALLGLVYLSDGYTSAKAVADELQVTVQSEALEEEGTSGVAPKPHLIDAAMSFTGQKVFKRHELVEQAFTHPTAMHPEVPSYQRLEWIGDAVLCLGVREWLVLNFPRAEVGKLVSMEASLVANETLGFLAISHGIQRHLNHCEASLPARIEFFEWSVRDCGRGLWGTDPPKVTADIVEALIGAVYLDSGFECATQAVRHILCPMMKGLEQIHSSESGFVLTHPKKALQEMGGSCLTLTVAKEDEFAVLHPKTPVWHGKRWGTATKEGSKYIATVECVGFNVVSVADASNEVAGNRACAFAVALLRERPDLLNRLQSNRTFVESAASKKANKSRGKNNTQTCLEATKTDTAVQLRVKGGAGLAEMEVQSLDRDDCSESNRSKPSGERCLGEILNALDEPSQMKALAIASAPAPKSDLDNDAAMNSVIESMLRNVFDTNDDEAASDGDSSDDLFG